MGKARQTLSSLELFKKDSRTYCPLSSLAAASRHHEESHLIYGPLESILTDQAFLVEYELDEFNMPHTGTTLSCLQLQLCRLWCKIPLRHPVISSLGSIFWRHSRFSSQTTRTAHLWTMKMFLSLTGKPSNSWTSWVYSHRPRVPSWIWIRWIKSVSHRNNFTSPSTLAMLTATQNFAQTSSHFILGQHLLEKFSLLSPNDQDHTLMGDYIIPVPNQQIRTLLT